MTDATNPTTTPAAAQAPAVAAAPVKTQVKIGEQTFELKDMKTEAGLELYKALPADYQKQADHIAHVLTTFASVREVAKAHSMDPSELARDWLQTASNSEAGRAAKAALTDAKKNAIHQLQSTGIDLRDLARMVPGGESLLAVGNTAKGVGAIIGTAGSAVGATADGAFNPDRVWTMATTIGAEAWQTVFGYGKGSPKEPAKAFAASAMALRYQSIQERHAKPLIDAPFNGVESQVEANPIEYGKAGAGWLVDWAKQNIPFAEYVIAGWRWLTTWGENKPTFDQFVMQARSEITQAQQKAPANGQHFAKLADEAMWDKEGKAAEQVLLAAGKIAGIVTTDGAAKVATASDTPYRDTHGVDRVLKNGVIVSEVTPMQRVKEAASAVVGDGSSLEQGLRGAAGTAAAVAIPVTVANNFAKGTVRGLTAHVKDVAPVTEKIMDWAKKPVQFGVGENAWTGWKGNIFNLPGTVSVGAGNLFGRSIHAVAATAAGVKDFFVGSTKGVHGLVNGADEAAKTAGLMQGMGKVAGTVGVAGIALAPVSTLLKTAQDIGEGKEGSATLHGIETVGLTAMMVKGGIKAGLKRVPYVGPIISGVEGVDAAAHGDKGGMVKAGAELGTMGSFAVAGAAIGSVIPVAGTAAGAAIGATIGGIVSIFTGTMAENHFVKKQSAVAQAPLPTAVTPTKPAGALGAPDEDLAKVVAATMEKAKQERIVAVAKASPDAVRNAQMAAGTVFARVASVQPGTGITPTGNLPQGSFAQMSLPPMA